MHGFGEPAGTNMLKVACHSFRQWAATLITSIGNARATLSWLPVAAWLLSQSAGAIAQTNNSYPMIMSIRPVAVPVGQTTECEVAARYNLHGAYKVLVSGDGVTGEVVPVEKPAEDKPGAKPNVPKIKVRYRGRRRRAWCP